MHPSISSSPLMNDDSCLHEHYAEIASTNDRLLDLARAGAGAGTLVSADYQSAGRGRRGAAWIAPAGTAVLCSALFRPTLRLPAHHLAILTGVGVANGLREAGFPVRIKWPNDLMLEERKVGGILIETVEDAVVVGFGINCTVPAEAFPEELRQRAGSLHLLSEAPVAREAIQRVVCQGLAEAFARVQAGSIISVLREWNTMNWLARRKVRVTGHMGAVEGNGLFLNGREMLFHVFKDCGVVPMPLSSSVEAR